MPNPQVAHTTQQSVTSESTTESAPAQAAWRRFVEQVERGEITDPVGQYVDKGTKVEVTAEGQRIARPKVDVLLRDASKGYALRAGQTAGSGTATDVIDEPCVSQDYDPVLVIMGREAAAAAASSP